MTDIWSEWLLKRRFGGNAAQLKRTLDYLTPIRDAVIANATLKAGDTLLDVGCGDGLIAFGALQAQPDVSVILSDISDTLLTQARQLATDHGVANRCSFIQAAADDLSVIADASVDAVTTRSVLIYVDAKDSALREFLRVLKPGGRLSIFEPVVKYGYDEPDTTWLGLDVTPVVAAANKMKALNRCRQPPDTDPMLNFDERDLVRLVESAGFSNIHLDYRVRVQPWPETQWDTFIHQAPNPKLLTFEDAMNQALTPDEKAAFIAHVRPQIEQRTGRDTDAWAFVWAMKGS